MSWVVKDLGVMEKDAFNHLCDAVSDAVKSRNISLIVIVMGANIENRPLFFACADQKAVKEKAVHCGELVKAASRIADGSGGGSPTRAQAGGKSPQKMAEALNSASEILSKKAGA